MLFVAACAIAPEIRSDLLRRGAEPVKLNSSVAIAEDRRQAIVRVENNGLSDISCPSVAVRSVFDNPNTYLESTEKVSVNKDIFLRPGEVMTIRISSSGVCRDVNVRSVAALEGADCRRAGFVDFCEHERRNELENHFLKRLFDANSAKDCGELINKLEGLLDLDFQGWGAVPARPLIYLPILRSVLVDDIIANRSTADAVRRRTESLVFVGFYFSRSPE